MLILKTQADIIAHLTGIKSVKKSIGFVPTMGALHQGHLSLIEASKAQNHCTVCSIFVNPTQFNNSADLDNYPRTLDQDITLLKRAKCDVLYLPIATELYPNGLVANKYDFGIVANAMEGKHRPGHFDGVGTIVSKFFDIIKPNRSYFGEKDFQQLAIIRKLTTINHYYDLEIIGCPILRESDGLAMSSRNLRLTSEMRDTSPLIYESLQWLKNNIHNYSIDQLIGLTVKQIETNGLLKVEYLEIADETTLQAASQTSDFKHLRAFAAIIAGEIRLIDNLHLF